MTDYATERQLRELRGRVAAIGERQWVDFLERFGHCFDNVDEARAEWNRRQRAADLRLDWAEAAQSIG